MRTRSNTSGTSDQFEKKNHRKLTINEGCAGKEDNYSSIQADKPEVSIVSTVSVVGIF